MKKLTKSQTEEIALHAARLEGSRRILENALADAQDIVNKALEEVNGLREEAAEFVRELYGKAEDYYEEKSDKWKDGDAGGCYAVWMDAMDQAANSLEEETNLDLASLAYEELDSLDYLSTSLQEMPTEPEE